MNEKEEKLVPDIRFRGLTHAWEQRKLGEISDIKTGSSNLQDAVEGGKYPFFVRSENIERSDKYLFDGEAILIPGEGKLGDIYHYINGKFDYHQRVYKISNFSDFEANGKFVLYYMQKNFKKHALKYTVKATVDSLRLPTLTRFNVNFPALLEQNSVSKFLFKLDQLLTLHERKLELLKELKKAFLQLMFPDKDETVPKLRFKGFDDEWEEKKLGEIFSERTERSSKGELLSVTINSGVVKASSLNKKDNSSSDKHNYKLVKCGDIAYNSMRMWQGASGCSSYDGIVSPAYTVIIPKSDINSKFIAFLFKKQNVISIFQRHSQGLTSDTWNLKFKQLSLIKIKLSDLLEQNKIENMLTLISKSIKLSDQSIYNLTQAKTYLLQKMFI